MQRKNYGMIILSHKETKQKKETHTLYDRHIDSIMLLPRSDHCGFPNLIRKLENFAKAIVAFRTTFANKRMYCESIELNSWIRRQMATQWTNLKWKLIRNSVIKALVTFRRWSGVSRRLVGKNRLLRSPMNPRYLITSWTKNITGLSVKCLFPCWTNEAFRKCFCFEYKVIVLKQRQRVNWYHLLCFACP